MKPIKTALLLLMLVITSCLEVETNSKVNTDGSIARTIQLKGSAESILETKFNIPRHDLHLWDITQDSVEDGKFLYRASATFESVDALNQSLKRNTNNPGVEIVAHLAIREGIFFTRYFYSEKLWADLPGPALSIEPYLTQNELEALLKNKEGKGLLDSLEAARLEAQWERYMEQLIFEDFIVELRQGGQFSGYDETVDQVIKEHSDSLFTALIAANYYDEHLIWKSILETYIRPHLVEEIYTANTEGFQAFYERWEFFEEVLLDDYRLSIELPGVIRETSALDVQGNQMSWEPETVSLFFGGVTLQAESSVIKPWGVIIAGLLLVLALIVMAIGFNRHRKP